MESATVGLKIPKTIESPDGPSTRSVGEWASHAEEHGYDSVWISEGWGSDAFVELATAATMTETVKLCTAIVNVYSRTPAVLAMAASSLSRVSDGRVVLGVGASHPNRVQSFHSMEYARPIRRSHEAIELIKAFTTPGEEVEYSGEVFEVGGVPPFDTDVPVYNAALGAANRRATGRVADGWLPYLLPLSKIGELFETVETAAREAERDPEQIAVTPQVLACVSDDSGAAKAELKRYIARYVGRRANYRTALESWYPEEMAAIHGAWKAGDRETARERVSDELLYELGVAGTPEEARDQLRSVNDVPEIDTPIVYVPNGTPNELRDRTIDALAPNRL